MSNSSATEDRTSPAGSTAGEKCRHCKDGWFPEQQFGQDVECVNGILIDIDIFTEGWHRDQIYPVAPCHPMWEKQCARKNFHNDCTKRLEDATHCEDAPAAVSQDQQDA